MITLQWRLDEEDGRPCLAPVVICDHCKETIHAGTKARLFYDWPQTNNQPRFVGHTHANCFETFESVYKQRTGHHSVWEVGVWLDEWMEFLANNYATPFSEKQRDVSRARDLQRVNRAEWDAFFAEMERQKIA